VDWSEVDRVRLLCLCLMNSGDKVKETKLEEHVARVSEVLSA
jgi:hypothetical protein